jgi:hypothetical protein
LTDREPWPRHVFIWGESQDAGEVGKNLLHCGFKPTSPVLVIAKSGKSVVGQTARLIWHPVNEGKVALSEVLARIDRARREGLWAVAVDTESEACYYRNMEAIAARARSNGMMVIHTPKAYLDHLPGTEAEDCAALNKWADAALLWIYGSHWSSGGSGSTWEQLIRMWHDNGLVIQAIPMCDSGRRAFEPYNSQQDIIEIARGAHAAGLSIGIFNPKWPESREELQEMARLYA